MDGLSGYLTNLASSQPTPGGGSAAMVCGSLACSLVAMVARICRDGELSEAADALRTEMAVLREEDEKAFEAVVAARGDRDATQRALTHAALAPLWGAQAACKALTLCERALALNNKHLVSDVGCAASFANAALEASAYNVRINHKYIKDPAYAQQVADQTKTLEWTEGDAREAYGRIKAAVDESFSG